MHVYINMCVSGWLTDNRDVFNLHFLDGESEAKQNVQLLIWGLCLQEVSAVSLNISYVYVPLSIMLV